MITARFTVTQDELAEAIARSSATLMTPRQHQLSNLWLVALATLIAIGSTTLVWLMRLALTGQTDFSYWLIAPAALLTFFAVQYPVAQLGWMVSTLHARTSETLVQVDATGLHITEGPDTYRTTWPGVHALTMGVTAILITTNGITHALPLRMLENPDATFAQLTAWRDA
jgi:hypothetical protein